MVTSLPLQLLKGNFGAEFLKPVSQFRLRYAFEVANLALR
jgi:hypothetical protein